MALSSVLENLDGLSEDLKKEYVSNEDGNFYLEVDGMERSETYTGLKTAYAQIKEEKKGLQGASQSYKKFGSPEDIQKMADENEKYKNSSTSEDIEKMANDRVESFRTQMAKTHLEEVTNLKNTISSQELSHRASEMQHIAMKAINDTGASGKLAAPYLAGVLNIDDGGIVFIKGEDGLPLYDKTGTKYVSVKDHLDSLRSVDGYKGMFSGSRADGGGSLNELNKTGGVIQISRSSPNFHKLLAKHAMDIKLNKAVIVS